MGRIPTSGGGGGGWIDDVPNVMLRLPAREERDGTGTANSGALPVVGVRSRVEGVVGVDGFVDVRVTVLDSPEVPPPFPKPPVPKLLQKLS